MALTHTVKQISPMLAVADMGETLQFYSNVLGFTVSMESADYSIIGRDGCSIHFMKAADQSVLDAVRGHTEIYIQVSGIRALWDYLCTFKNRYKIRDLFDQSSGMTEVHIEDPNGCLVFVGEPTPGPRST